MRKFLCVSACLFFISSACFSLVLNFGAFRQQHRSPAPERRSFMTVQSFKPVADTWIYEFRKDKNYGDGKGWQDITDPAKPVTLPKMFLGFGGTDKKIILVKFDTSAIDKNKEVKNASVKLYNDYAGSAASIKVDAKMITSPWEEMKVTYKTAPSVSAQVLSATTLQGSINYGQSGKWYVFDVTEAAKAWQKGSLNYGIMLTPQGDSGVDFDIVAREYNEMSRFAPVLEIEYK